MSATTVDISGFNLGMAGFVDRLGIAAPKVLKKEMGELLKTLIRVTPPKDPGKTRADIAEKVEDRFSLLGKKKSGDLTVEEQLSEGGGKHGKGDVFWYAFQPTYIAGVAKSEDMRSAGNKELAAIYFHTADKGLRRGRLVYRRGKQAVIIHKQIITRQSQRRRLITYLQGHVGRLKAGWLASWNHLSPGGGNQPPAWVKRHQSGARGYFIDGLGVKNHPTFTIANTAVGVGNPRNNLNWLVQSALNIRAKAMKANLSLFMHGKKNLADYARA